MFEANMEVSHMAISHMARRGALQRAPEKAYLTSTFHPKERGRKKEMEVTLFFQKGGQTQHKLMVAYRDCIRG